MFRIFAIAMLSGLVVAPAAHAGKKAKKNKKKGEPPPVGWHAEDAETWKGMCWYPPDFEAMGAGERRMAWSETQDQIQSQWSGARDDGIQMKDTVIIDNETVMFAKPERIPLVAAENLVHCQNYMKTGDASEWTAWLIALPGRLTVGECPNPPLDYTLFDYLNIGVEWQIPAYVCKDDFIKIKGSTIDYYRIEEGGPWINAEGDTSQPATGSLPCNIEGCFKGQLVMKFTSESGVTTVHAVGTYFEFRVPEHGKIQVMINDDTWHDNIFKVESGLEHHTSIEYSPVNK